MKMTELVPLKVHFQGKQLCHFHCWLSHKLFFTKEKNFCDFFCQGFSKAKFGGGGGGGGGGQVIWPCFFPKRDRYSHIL